MVSVTMQLDTLRCISQFDDLGNATSEPYLWVDFFFFDHTTAISEPDLVKTVNMLSGLSCRDLLPEGIKDGSVIDIPARLGKIQFVIDQAGPSATGVIMVLIDENETSDNLIRIGHETFGDAVRDELKKIVLSGSPDLTEDQKKEIADRVKKRVFDAIEAHAGIGEFFRRRDRLIGFATEVFTGPILQLLLDKAPGLPYPMQDRIRSERTIQVPSPFPPAPSPFPPLKVVDEYQIDGSIRVSAFQPPQSDPCQGHADTLAAANQAIEETDADLLDLQQQLRFASQAKQKEIRNKIKQLQTRRRTLVTQRDQAFEALRQCRSQHPAVSRLKVGEATDSN